MDEADTWLFKEQDKWAKTAFPIPNSPGSAWEFHLTWGQHCALKQSAVWSDCSPVGRPATAHSRVIDWINSLIPNRWIEYWCLVRPDHKRKTQSASRLRGLTLNVPSSYSLPVLCPRISSEPFAYKYCQRGFYHHSPAFFSFREIFFQNIYKQGKMFNFYCPH